MRCRKALIPLVLIVIFTTLCLTGCEGPQGPAGRDATIPDTQAPVVNWVYPFGGAELVGVDTLLVEVTDNTSVDSVTFIVNGRTEVDGLNKLTPSGSVYRSSWDTRMSPTGTYTLMVRAYDHAGNVGLSSPISISLYNVLTGQNPLRNFANSPDIVGWNLPDVDHTSIYAVQLTPVQACSLVSIQYEWIPFHPGQNRTDTLLYYLIESDSVTGAPGRVLDSMIINPDSIPRHLATVSVPGRLWAAHHTWYIGLGMLSPTPTDTVQIPTDTYPYLRKDWYYVPQNGWSRIPLAEPDPHNIMLGAIVLY